jgi:histidinol-phosphate/aromatic aminotransferase/cobyric acid decarboxylase-like protein
VNSISKSYGVPGARLGLLASSDTDLVNRIRNRTPIWNVNAIGEYFLQILTKYEDDYPIACAALRNERRRFQELLSGLSGFRVIPSQANFVLCELTGVTSAAEFTERVLADHNVLVRDCSNKPGMNAGQYLRIAVRSPEDNDLFIAAARAIVGP